MTGVSVEWVDDNFTSLRVTVPEGGMYRISCLSVNKSNATEPKVVATSSSSLVVEDFKNDCDTIIFERVPLDTTETGNGSGGIGEQSHVTLGHIHLVNTALTLVIPFFLLQELGLLLLPLFLSYFYC